MPIRSTILIAGVSRSTVYYWMDRAWIHWRELPSGRRVIWTGGPTIVDELGCPVLSAAAERAGLLTLSPIPDQPLGSMRTSPESFIA
jgi:hypothetical protein